ncbi:MAG TPA: LuxR C-terminal-related transcriptional regulator [Bacteroidales bacterium]|nr:LuxR C-terminal-related transcriptional regulator [Bacteroidales bacterium]
MLLTKLHIPSSGDHIVHRSGLFDKLNAGLNRKLILISAPAGFGKTTLVSDWINQLKIPAAWFSLDKSDNDPVEFLSYVITGIQTIQCEFGQNALRLLKSPGETGIMSIADLLINEMITIGQDFILVLDDFHLISSGEIKKLVTYFLEHIPGNIHFVLSSRSDPVLEMARLRSQNQLVELRASDLCFKTEDISYLFNKKLKLGLSVDDIHTLENKTEGWIAGLQLTALSLQSNADISGFIRAFKGDNRYIMDYLIEEVLKIQTEDVKEFLVNTSILEQFSAPLCDALLNRTDSRLILEKLEKNNLFVFSLDAERQWYRYHHLFADLLKQRLLLNDSTIVEILHNKACIWFEQNNLFDLAIAHALEIKNFEKAIQLLDRIVESLWQNGHHTVIMNYGDTLPDELIKKNPGFCLYYSWILITSGQIQKARPFLLSAEQICVQLISDKSSSKDTVQFYGKLLGKIAVAFAYSFSNEEHSDKIFDYCELAMKHLTADDPLWYSWAWFSSAIAQYSNGDLLASKAAFNTAFEYGKKSGNIYLISTIAIRMAENEQQLGFYKTAYQKCIDLLELLTDKGYLQIARGDWTFAALYFILGISQYNWAENDKAIENIKRAYDLSKQGKDIYLKITILMVYSVVLLELGDSEAEKKIRELDELYFKNSIPPFLKSYYIGWKIYLCFEKNDLDKAQKIVSHYDLDLSKEKTPANESAYSSYVRLLMAQNRLDEAESLLSELYVLAREGKRNERMIDCLVSWAILHEMKGRHDEAVSHIIQAMELASDENLLIGFVLRSHEINALLKDAYKIQTTTKTKISDRFIENLKMAVDRRTNQLKMRTSSELSSRELETLKMITGDLSNQEIADKLFISLNTVKTHLKNIYLKLEVDSRSKAVAKAKEIGLL